MAVLPQDIVFDNACNDTFDQVSPAEYKLEATASLQDNFSQVVDTLKLSKKKMQRNYNRNVRFINHQVADKVWLKVKFYKTGKNRKFYGRDRRSRHSGSEESTSTTKTNSFTGWGKCREILASKVATVSPEEHLCHIRDYKEKEFCLLGNFLACEGKTSKVLRIHASQRIGEDNFVTCIRKIVDSEYGAQCVGMGGVFIIHKGKANLHVMPDFSQLPLKSDNDVKEWLKFYESSSPLICLSVLVSSDPGLDLRIEHTHCFSYHDSGRLVGTRSLQPLRIRSSNNESPGNICVFEAYFCGRSENSQLKKSLIDYGQSSPSIVAPPPPALRRRRCKTVGCREA
eukprot:gene13893-4841_t